WIVSNRCVSLDLCLSSLTTPPISTFFPYTTLFRSPCRGVLHPDEGGGGALAAGVVAPVLERCAPRNRILSALLNTKADLNRGIRSEEHTSELQSRENLVCRLLLEKKKTNMTQSLQK